MSLQRPLVPQPEVDLAQLFSLGPRTLRRSWFVATVLGGTVGLAVPTLVGLTTFRLAPTLPLALAMPLVVMAGVIGGVALGAAQAVVLGREFLGFPRLAWAIASGLGAGLAWTLGMPPLVLYPAWADGSFWLIAPLGVLLCALALAGIGIAQWVVLRRHIAHSRSWVVVSALGWIVGAGALAPAAILLREAPASSLAVAVTTVLGGMTTVGLVALVTAVWLAHLVRPRPGAGIASSAPPGVPEADWAALGRSTDEFRVFDPTAIGDLPEPVQRWMRHTMPPGTALLTGLDAEWAGHIHVRGHWRAFSSRERATLRHGFVWSARTRSNGLPVAGLDRFTRGEGQIWWRTLRRLRVASAEGEHVARSAAGRHAMEMLITVPAVALHPAVQWEPVDHRQAIAHIVVGGEHQAVTVDVDSFGQLRQVVLDRWGAPQGSPFGRYPFGAQLSDERRVDGYLVPTEVVAGWHIGTRRWDEGIFLRYHVTRCSFH